MADLPARRGHYIGERKVSLHMLGTAHGAVLEGMDATVVLVEADVTAGIPQFQIVGLPDSAVSESKLRIRSAIRNAGLQFPSQRITVNLSPASVRKRGPGLDLAIAVAILRASGQLPGDTERPGRGTKPVIVGFCAELGLSGQLVPIGALVNLALALRQHGRVEMCISTGQVSRCVALPNVQYYPFDSLASVVQALSVKSSWPAPVHLATDPFSPTGEGAQGNVDMSEVEGMAEVKRALTIAASGGLHALLVGPPGCGKTMLAERVSTILPQLDDESALEVYAIHQAAQLATPPSRTPPLRNPHHSVTAAGLIGGGYPPLPGEATLAHHGVLLLDEMAEFDRTALNTLREPLVNRHVRLARSGKTMTLPADFLLLGTMNPCPCGARGFGECRCAEREVERYWSRLSGPLLDRIDLVIVVSPTTPSFARKVEETSASMRMRVSAARALLSTASGNRSQTGHSFHPEPLSISDRPLQLLTESARQLRLSQRASASVRRIASAIAALDGRTHVLAADVQEALGLRAVPVSSSSHSW
ncbi:YifB family Mg chelatase-like AAA ATPase [Alicyclobacillus sp. ALC3]|uniref:YifB family Mg chelatase-like AAA ATPase n=1 Tax=Alicyclobacillus sp. ALC3 TaxID=2796143 RepID=UPI002377D77E|nr:YifB family Mg chelatase-like AAA ATPase [Alicyclobacillus sp. ALC3]WDL97367.1 YifB family Mg chelatase-like AAA ATPase [Alicyclobacillus sp. ALC3]